MMGRSGQETERVWMGTLAALGILFFVAACNQAPASPRSRQAAQSDAAAEAQYQSAARKLLGTGSQVILSGDLAHNGHIQLLVVNRLPARPHKDSGGLRVSRAAILEKDAGDWREIFLADDHLKNEAGYLPGTPSGSVTAWRFQCEKGKDGLAMSFTPLQQADGPESATIEVRWNPRKQRYQSYDRQTSHFFAEDPTAGNPPSFMMKR